MPLAVLLASLSLLPSEDFLVSRPSTPTTLTKDGTSTLLLSNGLISRRFATAPNFATVSLRSEVSFDTGGVVEVIRGVGPEARITLSCGVGHRRGLLAYAAGKGHTVTVLALTLTLTLTISLALSLSPRLGPDSNPSPNLQARLKAVPTPM